MSDLISREAAIFKMKVNIAEAAALKATDPCYIGFLQVFEKLFIQELGECVAVDAVEVVRCKDCVYQVDAKVNCKGFTICPASGMEITDDDFCSYGERRESEGE